MKELKKEKYVTYLQIHARNELGLITGQIAARVGDVDRR